MKPGKSRGLARPAIELEWRVCWSKNQIRHFCPVMSGLNVETKVSARFVPMLTCYPSTPGTEFVKWVEWISTFGADKAKQLLRLQKRIKEHRDFTLHIKAAQRKGYSVVQHTELVAYLNNRKKCENVFQWFTCRMHSLLLQFSPCLVSIWTVWANYWGQSHLKTSLGQYPYEKKQFVWKQFSFQNSPSCSILWTYHLIMFWYWPPTPHFTHQQLNMGSTCNFFNT